jgi:hypothetical protein
MSDQNWQVAKVTGIGKGELWFDVVEGDLGKKQAHHRARGSERYIAIPMNEMPDNWGEQWLNGDLGDDPYA